MCYELKVHWLKRILSSIQIFLVRRSSYNLEKEQRNRNKCIEAAWVKKKKNPPELLVTLSVFIFIFAFLYFLISLQRACIICANLNSFFLKPLLVLCSLPIGKVYIYLVYTYKDKCLIPFYTFKVFCFLFSQETWPTVSANLLDVNT